MISLHTLIKWTPSDMTDVQMDTTDEQDNIINTDKFKKYQRQWRKRSKNMLGQGGRGQGDHEATTSRSWFLRYKSLRYKVKNKPEGKTVKVYNNRVKKYFSLNCNFCKQEVSHGHLLNHCPVINSRRKLNGACKRLSRIYQLSLAINPGD